MSGPESEGVVSKVVVKNVQGDILSEFEGEDQLSRNQILRILYSEYGPGHLIQGKTYLPELPVDRVLPVGSYVYKPANVQPPLPAKTQSYANITSSWFTGKAVEEVDLLHVSAVGAEGFKGFWREHSGNFVNLSVALQTCLQENTDQPYREFGSLVLKVWGIMNQIMEGGTSSGRTRGESQNLPTLFYNKKAGDETRPDVAVCAVPPWVALVATNMYEHLIKVAELKVDIEVAEGTVINAGKGQIIARAESARFAKGIDKFTLPGVVTDNRLIYAMVVYASNHREDQKVMMSRNPLWLMKKNASKHGLQPIDTKSEGYKELVFLCWLSATGHLRAAAESPKLTIPEDGLDVAVRAGDGSSSPFRLLEQLSVPGTPYLVCSARVPHEHSSFVIKMGPPPDTVTSAKGLCLCTDPYLQVEREVNVLHLLRRHQSPFLPQLACAGQLAAPSPSVLRDRPAVVTHLRGRALVGPDGVFPTLSPSELLHLASDVLAGIRDLQGFSILNNDIRPENLGVSSTNYYLFDLGCSSCLNAAEPGRTFPCSLLYSSTQVLQGAHPNAASDYEMLLYSLVVLAGRLLPWADAAAEGDRLGCLYGRMQLAHTQQLPGAIQSLPFPLPAFARGVLQCVARGGSTSGLAKWVPVLKAAAERLEQTQVMVVPCSQACTPRLSASSIPESTAADSHQDTRPCDAPQSGELVSNTYGSMQVKRQRFRQEEIGERDDAMQSVIYHVEGLGTSGTKQGPAHGHMPEAPKLTGPSDHYEGSTTTEALKSSTAEASEDRLPDCGPSPESPAARATSGVMRHYAKEFDNGAATTARAHRGDRG